MFKSVFTKYITAFMLIIIISFAMLVSIIVSIVNAYSLNAKEDLVFRASHAATEFFESELNENGFIMNFDSYVREHEDDYTSMFAALSDYAEDVMY